MHVKVLVYCILFLFSCIPIIYGDRPQMNSDIYYLYHKLGVSICFETSRFICPSSRDTSVSCFQSFWMCRGFLDVGEL